MTLNAPKKLTWLIAIILGALGLFLKFVAPESLEVYAFWSVLAGLVVLALGNSLKGF